MTKLILEAAAQLTSGTITGSDMGKKSLTVKKTDRRYWGIFVAILVAVLSTQFAFAAGEAMWTNIKSFINSIYTGLVGISTAAAVVCIVIAILVRMFSKNDKAVQEATSWIKRIVISWVIINSLATLLTFGQDMITGAGFTRDIDLNTTT